MTRWITAADDAMNNTVTTGLVLSQLVAETFIRRRLNVTNWPVFRHTVCCYGYRTSLSGLVLWTQHKHCQAAYKFSSVTVYS